MLKKLCKPICGLMLAMALGSGSMLAQNAVKLSTPEGVEVYYQLSSRPEIRFEDSTVLLTAEDVAVSYPMPVKVEFVDYTEPASVESLDATAPLYRVTDTQLEVSGHSAGVPVLVYDSLGRLAAEGRTDSAGHALVVIADLTRGVYVVNVESVTFKIYKK